jgi:hypothetical protein
MENEETGNWEPYIIHLGCPLPGDTLDAIGAIHHAPRVSPTGRPLDAGTRALRCLPAKAIVRHDIPRVPVKGKRGHRESEPLFRPTHYITFILNFQRLFGQF